MRTVGGDFYVVGHGPTTASTCTVLDRPGRFIFDTNRYYADLGVKTDANRRELRKAYQARDGSNSARLTYVLKQLLDPDIRRRYDATPLGSLFLDEYVMSWIRQRRVQESSALRAQGRVAEAEELEADSLGGLLDTEAGSDQDDVTHPDQTMWPWAFYLRRSDCFDVGRISQWQELLVSALARVGVHLQLEVGFCGDMASEWDLYRDGDRILVFLNEGEQPTEALAQQVASRVVQHRQPVLAEDHEHGDKKNMAFRTGAEAAKDAAKSSGGFARTNFFGLGDGDTAIIRLLTDANAWITVDQHQMVPTKPKPADYSADAKWPEKMGSVCRKDPAFEFGECYICENLVDGKKVKKAAPRQWALACLREEVIEEGKIVGYKDKTREVTIPAKDGQPERTVTEKAIVVVNMAYKNFFSLLEGFAGRYGTVLDRDYWIKRNGDDKDTSYNIVPIDPIQTPEGIFDLREPKFMERYETDLDLATVITERADDEFYAKFFDPRFTVIDDKVVPSGSAPAVSAPQAQDPEVDPDRLAALASRVKGYSAPTEAPAESAPQSAPEAEKASAAAGGLRDFS